MAVPTVADIKAVMEGYCEIAYGLVSDTWISNMRDNVVVKWLEGKIGFSLIAEEEIVEYYDGTNSNILILSRKPVISLTKVEYVDRVNVAGQISLSSFVLIADEGVIKALKNNFSLDSQIPVFPKGEQNIRITYRAGYGTIPGDLNEAIKYLVCEKILSFLEGRSGGGNVSIQGYSRDYGERGKYTNIRNELTRLAMACLDDYLTAVL
jgi:hypothetical protein